MAQNRCKWLYKNDYGLCSRRCVGDYCAAHNQQIKNGSVGMITCIKCGQGIKVKLDCVQNVAVKDKDRF